MENDEFKTVKTGNGVDRDLAATTNERLKLTVIELRNLGGDVKELNANIVSSGKSSDRYSKRILYLTWALVIFTVVLVAMTAVLIIDSKNQTSSENNISLNSLFFNSVGTKIISVIENNQPILTENHGQFSDAQLDNYLGSFDIIQSAYDEGLLSENDFCDSFSYYVGITASNKEVQNYIASQQKGDPADFTSVAYLANLVAGSKDPNCK